MYGRWAAVAPGHSRVDPVSRPVAFPRLIALDRGGGKARPIAIGDAWRRLACSTLLRALKLAIEERCVRARNLAFSKDGANTIARAAQLPFTLAVSNRLYVVRRWLRVPLVPVSSVICVFVIYKV